MAKYTKRRDKRGYEWKSAYREKKVLCWRWGYPEVSPHDFIGSCFRLAVSSKNQRTEKAIL